MTEHRLGTQEEWQAKRNELLTEEGELTHRSDELYRDGQLASPQSEFSLTRRAAT